MVGMLVGCVPQETAAPASPAPSFATEAEAFAAAEQVYRTYTDAANAARGGDATADPFEYVVATAYELDLDAVNSFHEMGILLTGSAEVLTLVPQKVDLKDIPQTMTAVLCMDWSGVRAIDAEGNDVTPPQRPEISGLLVTFVVLQEGVRISNSQVPPESVSC